MSRRGRTGRREQQWRGVAVSEGSAVGRVMRVHGGSPAQVYRATVDASDVRRELRRFHAAVRLARRQLASLKRRAEHLLGAEHASIFDAHLLMLEDPKLAGDVEKYIRDERANAEWAVKVVGDRLLAVYADIKDEYLRERGSDVDDVLRRLLAALSGEPRSSRLTEDAVLVAEELLPSAVAELDFAHVRAIVSDAGGWTSHAAIIARGLGIPAVVGVRDLFRHARTGDEIAVDAVRGEVLLHPAHASAEGLKSRAAALRAAAPGAHDDVRAPLLTADGVEIILRANVELPVEFEGVRRYGARGVGLYRSEFLFSQRDGRAPTEDEQFRAYAQLAELTGEDGAKIRLFDLGGDKLGAGEPETERNPALGLRAIRLCLRREDVLRTQARAVLRAAARGRLDLVLPMISDIEDVRRVRAVIEEERARLVAEGQEIGEIKIGAMIEVPAAVFVADKLAREVDFFSLGTNDLVQYLLAVDRSNDEVAEWFRSLHPAVLQSVHRAVAAARDAGIPSIVCGEMASGAAYATVLVGLGARELSMTATAIPRVRAALAG
ncbi:MAG: phosphoenolpyruvate--protein phosphotransferase, partial [Acidobacteria bacterium]|nr:phosphoenolpyruvate--protein phosphotransferase [Acidobacteriota bacterium]